MDKSKIVPVGTNRPEVKVWLDEVSKMATHIYIGIAVGSENDELAKAEAERVRNERMYNLRTIGYEMVGEATTTVADGLTVTKYVFEWSEWKRKVMHADGS